MARKANHIQHLIAAIRMLAPHPPSTIRPALTRPPAPCTLSCNADVLGLMELTSLRTVVMGSMQPCVQIAASGLHQGQQHDFTWLQRFLLGCGVRSIRLTSNELLYSLDDKAAFDLQPLLLEGQASAATTSSS